MKSPFNSIWDTLWDEGDVLFEPLNYEIITRDEEVGAIETDLMTLNISACDYYAKREAEFEQLMMSISLMAKEWFGGVAIGMVVVQNEMDERVVRFYSMEYDN